MAEKFILSATGEKPKKKKRTILEHLKARTKKKGFGVRFTFAEIERQKKPPIKFQFEVRAKKVKLPKLGDDPRYRHRGVSGKTRPYAGFRIKF